MKKLLKVLLLNCINYAKGLLYFDYMDNIQSTKIALTIAGSDPSGGAGIQADLKTFHQFKVYGEAVITLLTVQNTQTVSDIKMLDANFVINQIQAVFEDIPPNCTKIGALGNSEIADAVAWSINKYHSPTILDPVMISKHNKKLIDDDCIDIIKNKILKNCLLATPNIPEAEVLSEYSIKNLNDMKKAASSISKLGIKNVLIKGGHLDSEMSNDYLLSNGTETVFEGKRFQTKNTHGTGCTYSAAICANFALYQNLLQSVKISKSYIERAISTNPNLGKGFGPLNFFA